MYSETCFECFRNDNNIIEGNTRVSLNQKLENWLSTSLVIKWMRLTNVLSFIRSETALWTDLFVGPLVGQSVCHNFIKGWQVSLLTLYWSTCFILDSLAILSGRHVGHWYHWNCITLALWPPTYWLYVPLFPVPLFDLHLLWLLNPLTFSDKEIQEKQPALVLQAACSLALYLYFLYLHPILTSSSSTLSLGL